ncbi:glycoside hydrolase family 1 protein [Vibrio renipiscarius]|uniref:6-phospho-beta-glucosidase n=1 Tax=Vibrio renipiscarius TaxID=1461322 RepID=A0A0C2NRE5_9VIBR|nr:glycoside hydrolase family 1 protein [Vibrio renipiscarius]KII75308.1 6-phospho-beta-glucosidase [Vibrio renipiscarius]KII78760.1 6-phospho-beta-glucosidase [Vibrio renipiscarius]
MKIFPQGFWWGSATSAAQSEGSSLKGGKSASIWDHWHAIQPERFHNGVGCADASTFYENWRDDIALMKELGHNSFRTSIAWSRLIPSGDGEINQEAVDFYSNVIDELIEQGIEPFINLYHFDMPLCMQEKGGWESREVVDAYANYAKTCFVLFGDRVVKWFTHNEPIVPVEGGYLYDFHYPNIVDFKRAATVAHNTLVAHSKAVIAYRSLGLKGEIGIILNLTPSYPRSQNQADLLAAERADLLFNRSFLDPVTKGEYPSELVTLLSEYGQLPGCHDGDLEIIKAGVVDLLGVNFYFPRRVQAPRYAPHPDALFMPEWFFEPYEMPGRKMNPHRGWEIYEEAMYDIAINLKDNYNNIPWFVSENGMGVEGEEKFRAESFQIQDDYRIEFVKEHLSWLHKAIDEGANCKGYHLWTFIDCWSWCNAYKNRYGWIELDLETQARRMKKSGQWFAQVSNDNGFE